MGGRPREAADGQDLEQPRSSGIAGWLEAVRRPSPRTERIALVVAALAMVTVAGWLLVRGEVPLLELRLLPLVAAAVIGVPLSVATNAIEFALSARLVGVHVRFGTALRVTITATAANLLPVPGGPAVRIQALRSRGTGLGTASAVTVAVGLLWVSTAAAVATTGAWLAGSRASPAVAMGALAIITAVVAIALLRRGRTPWQGGTIVAIVAVELASVLVTAGRLLLVLLALGEPASVSVAFVLALAGVLATVIGVVPAGLGVREALSAALATFVAVPAAVGFVVSLVDRVVGLLVVAPVGLLLARSHGTGSDAAERIGPSSDER